MSDYGFVMKVEDLTSAQMKKIEESIRSLGGTVKTQTSQMGEDFKGLGEAANNLKRQLIEAFSVYEIYNFGKELLNITSEFQTYNNVIKYSSINTVDAADNMDYLNNAVNRLHLPMQQAYEQFSAMQAGFYGTGIEGDKLRQVFEGVAEAATVMHLSPDAFSRTAYAMKEIGELGTVQMRQMRMLAMALPGTMTLAAKSMGMTSAQFHESMKKGKINSAEFLPKFSQALINRFHSGLPNASESLMSIMNQTKTDFTSLLLDMGDKLMPLFQDIFSTIQNGVKEIREVWDNLTSNSNFVNALKNIFDIIVKIVPMWLAYKAVMLTSTGITSLLAIAQEALGGSMVAVAEATEGATVAVGEFDMAIAGLGVGALVAGLTLVVEQLAEARNNAENFANSIYDVHGAMNKFKENQKIMGDLSAQASQWGKLSPEDKQDAINTASDQYKRLHKDSLISAGTDSLMSDTLKKISTRDSIGSKNNFLVQKHLFHKPDTIYMPDIARRDSIDEVTKHLSVAQSIQSQGNRDLENIRKLLKKGADEGISPIGGGKKPKGPGKDQTLNTSNLSGANGGLGQARIINMHIGVVQQNNGVKESHSSADQAVQKIIEAINGFDSSQNSQ